MAWLGFATWITIYWCVFLTITSGRIGWVLLGGWLVPILALAINYQSGMEINGLMVLICFLMFFVCRRGISDVRMWNIKLRRRHTVLFGVLYVLIFAMFFYSFAQAQIQGYLLNVQGWGREEMHFLRMGISTIPMLFLCIGYAQMTYTAIERIFCRRRGLILLNCNFFMANENGVEKGLRQGYFLEGIQNGVTYYFRMTRRTFYMLKKESVLRLQTNIGLFGGMYVHEMDDSELLKRVRKQDRRNAKWGLGVCLIFVAAGVWLFWFRA